MKGTVIVIIAILIAALIASGQSPTAAQSPQQVEEAPSDLSAYLDSLVKESKLSGVVLVAKDGVTLASKAAGVANKATGAAIDLNTKFNLGSMNKMFTAVAIAQLAQAGKLSFTDTVAKHLPDYPNKDAAQKVTIHHLLTHTSGMGVYWGEKFAAQREKLLTVSAHLPLFASEPLSFPPGEKFQYSNSGFMLLGGIIEKVSGKDYYSYVREHIYKPAGMNDTGFYEPGKEIPNLAVGYTRMSPQGQPQEEIRDNNSLREVKGGPAGGGFSTAPDLVKFHQALVGYKLLDKTHTELVTTGKVEGPRGMGKYGYGFGDRTADGKHSVGHNGGGPGIAANLEMFPELGYTAVALMNSDPPTLMPIVKGVRDRIPAK
ncbi:MAG TPA: serine hydrolase domain-containing protein [Chthoniobacterales bacterium]|jgi:CubicO group peptidase (beta-lactamase class C family)|nr:serine hydrolase domain-containing protein [Chthoniobacterales bacterium]